MSDIAGRRFPIVAIGASAGGIEAFRVFFERMPVDSGLPFIVSLHLPVNVKSALPTVIGRWSAMSVVEATDGCIVEPNTVYLPPAGVMMTFRDGRLLLHPTTGSQPREHYPISRLFSSLADALEENAIGIVLSGTGHDGAVGIQAIKRRGGLTLAQGVGNQGPQHKEMPESAIATGSVDIVASVEAMPARILAVLSARRSTDPTAQLPAVQAVEAQRAISAALVQQIGHDFSGYKVKTFLRRVARRMQVLGLTSIEAFTSRLQQDRHEAVMLFHELLIGVTSFFRDKPVFDALERDIIPRIVAGKRAEDTIRVWVCGCASGEEVYSLAIVLQECLDTFVDACPSLQLFATDIDDIAIATARAGRYPAAALQDVSPERLARFFVPGIDGSYTISKALRDLCTFSPHSLTRDPPFSRMDLVSCRNLLIYLDPEIQDIVLPAFHYALMPDGFLLLGSSETVARHEALFNTIDRPHRIFQKRDVPGPPLRITGRIARREKPVAATSGASDETAWSRAARPSNWAHARILDRYAPPFLVVTRDGISVQYSSHLTPYLELAPGLPSHNALHMARPGLRGPLREALHTAAETGRAVERPNVVVRTGDGRVQYLTLVVEPQRDGTEALFLVVLLPGGEAAIAADDLSAVTASDRDLERELRETAAQLQAMTEEHDTTIEELRSTNEELQSVNEELQSTNEELETSKEEIQSVNEELQTVNGQLASKVDELDQKNSDLKNLFDSTQVATIFLDRYLVIRSFTPAVARLYNLIPSDAGRPLADIVSALDYDDLREDCRCVLQTLEPLERRVGRSDGSGFFLVRILPYRTQDSRTEGVIITFVEVTSIVEAERHQRLLVDELNHRVRNMLTVVISIAAQTLQSAPSLEAFEEDFMGRIHALSGAYSLLSSAGWRTVPVEMLLIEELRPFRSRGGANVKLLGPEILLRPRAALALGMAIHELTTNAVKHGALSTASGVVEVSWHRETTMGGDQLVLRWIESGGPAAAEPPHRGFGLTLIERGLQQDASADVAIEFLPSGVCATLRLPLPNERNVAVDARE